MIAIPWGLGLDCLNTPLLASVDFEITMAVAMVSLHILPGVQQSWSIAMAGQHPPPGLTTRSVRVLRSQKLWFRYETLQLRNVKAIHASPLEVITRRRKIFCRGQWFAEWIFFADLIFEIFEQMPFSTKMPRWPLTCSPWGRGAGGDCVTCCLLKKAEME